MVGLMATDHNDGVAVDQERFVEARLDFIGSAYGRQSDAYIDMLGTSSIALQDHRPWLAMAYRQRQIEARLARGEAPEALLSERLAMANLLLEAGEYARLAAYTDGMVSDLARLSEEQLAEKDWLMLATHRIRARGRRQMNAADTRQTYEEALDVLFIHGD